MLKENHIVYIQPITLTIDELVLNQYEPLLILKVSPSEVTFKRLATDTVHTTPKIAIEIAIQKEIEHEKIF